MMMMFGGELDSGHYDAFLPVEEKEREGIFIKFVFIDNISLNHFLHTAAPLRT
jgi:hypothetical protein